MSLNGWGLVRGIVGFVLSSIIFNAYAVANEVQNFVPLQTFEGRSECRDKKNIEWCTLSAENLKKEATDDAMVQCRHADYANCQVLSSRYAAEELMAYAIVVGE